MLLKPIATAKFLSVIVHRQFRSSHPGPLTHIILPENRSYLLHTWCGNVPTKCEVSLTFRFGLTGPNRTDRSAIVLFRSLPHVFGTVCRCTSRLHPRCLFFAVVWRRTSSDATFRDSIFCFFVFFLIVVPVKWLVIIGHVNRSFYLLTDVVENMC